MAERQRGRPENESTDSSAAPTSAAEVADVSRCRRPTSATTTGNVSVVTRSNPAAAAGRLLAKQYSTAGTAL